MKYRVLVSAAVIALGAVNAALADNVFFVGHSLVNFTMPHMLQRLADSGPSVNHTYRSQIINGSPLWNNWLNGASAQGYNARTEIPGADYDALIVTEAVPLQNHLTWSNAYNAADSFYNLAVDANPSARVYMYETWHCINSGVAGDSCWYDNGDNVAWRQRLRDDLPKWEGVVDTVNRRNPSPDMLLVPGGQALGVLDDAIRAGDAGGLTNLRTEIFTDDIHLTNTGNYYIACVMYATIYARTPVGLTNHILGSYGEEVLTLSPTLALRLQQLAWQTVSNYPRAWSNTVATRSSVTIRRDTQRSDVALYSLTGQRVAAGHGDAKRSRALRTAKGAAARVVIR